MLELHGEQEEKQVVAVSEVMEFQKQWDCSLV